MLPPRGRPCPPRDGACPVPWTVRGTFTSQKDLEKASSRPASPRKGEKAPNSLRALVRPLVVPMLTLTATRTGLGS